MLSIGDAATIEDLRRIARRRLPGFAFTYIDEGAGDDRGVMRNCDAFGPILLEVRRLRGAGLDVGVGLFGRDYRLPFGIAPIGLANLAWPGTDLALAAMAERNGMPYVISTAATTSLEEIARVAPNSAWFQLYPARDEAITADLLGRASRAGISVLVLTIDVPGSPRRNRSIRGRVAVPFRYTPRVVADLALHPGWALRMLTAGPPALQNYGPYLQSANVQVAGRMMGQLNKHGLTWDDVARVREMWDGTLVLKGIMGAEDSRRAVAAGADGLWVSNHGGRQLESSPASITVLPKVREAVGNQVPLFLDSGVRSGEDVVKALALGADMVFCGRAFIYGAAAGGQAGVDRALDIVRAEFDAALSQIGCRSLGELPEFVAR